MIYEKLVGLLPQKMIDDGYAENFKKVLKVYSDIASINDNENVGYGKILDIYEAVGNGIDFIGNMYAVFRVEGEPDLIYRERIINTVIARRTPTTIPELQQAIDSIVENGKLHIYENHRGDSASVYITGSANEDDVRRSFSLIKEFLPAGVGLTVPVVTFAKWQSIKDQFRTWESLKDEGYIW